jgi:hypothetical protein
MVLLSLVGAASFKISAEHICQAPEQALPTGWKQFTSSFDTGLLSKELPSQATF